MADKQGLFSGLSLRRPPAASSVGTNGGGRSSSETIAHPLLGASTSSSSLVSEDAGDASTPTATASSTTDNAPLPYKARQRPSHGSRTPTRSSTSTPTPAAPDSPGTAAVPSAPAAAPTTSTTTTFAMPSDEAGAASRLQLQSLKAAAQRIGLSNGAMGMGMVDAIFEKGARARADGDWAELLKVLTSGKTVLLLPLSPASSLPMTPQTLRDHIAYLSPPLLTAGAPPASVLVTLSGLIGTLQGTSVSFESSIPPDSALLTALKDENQRAAVLSSLRPTQLGAASAPSADYPVYTVSGENTSLPFPPLGRGPAPPPDKKAEARRMNPFMSLFGSSSSTPRTTGALSPERPSSPDTSRVSSPPKSIISLDSEQAPDGYSVTAYTLDRHIRFAEVHKMLVKAVRSTVRSELEGLPDRVIDKVLRLVVGAVCPVNGSVDQALLKSHHGLGSSDTDIPLDFSDPAAMGERLQDFMEAVHDDLVRHLKSEAEAAPEEDEKTSAQDIETQAGEGTERVEATVCRLLYNRIFSPRQSDDARHDEALASRIAALNMLDLSLDHLGLVTHPPDEPVKGTIARGLASLVDDIGKELQKLASPQFLTPKDKADVLVSAHKIAVDGLAQLPPIQLRPEGEPYRPDKDSDSDSDSERQSDGDRAGNRDEALGTINELAEMPSTPVGEVPAKGAHTEDAETEDAETEDAETEDAPTQDAATKNASAENASNEHAPERGAEAATESPDPEKDVSETPTPKKESDEESAPATADEKAPRQATSGADLILPMIIFAVVKSNPAQLASQLLYLRRYRSAICLRGEESYVIVNLTAVVEFLEHVQLSELGLGDEGTKVMSVADLTPIAVGEMPAHDADTASIASASSRLRGRVFQVGSELAGSAAGSANKVITGVVDSGISALRGFMSATATATATPEASQTPPPQAPASSNGANSTAASTTAVVPGAQSRARGASTFSLASVTAGMAHIASAASTAASGAGRRSRSNTGEFGAQELLEVPAPGRAASHSDGDSDAGEGGSGGEAGAAPVERSGRARSIVSVSSMMRDEREAGSSSASARGTSPAGLSGRIASLGARLAPSNAAPLDWPIDAPPSSTPPDKPGFFASLSRQRRSNTTSSAGTATATIVKSPSGTALGLADDPPIERFMTCEVGDIRLHEVGALLRDYRRIAGALARLQAQQPHSQ